MNVYQDALIPRKLPCPKKFLVTRLERSFIFNFIVNFTYSEYTKRIGKVGERKVYGKNKEENRGKVLEA